LSMAMLCGNDHGEVSLMESSMELRTAYLCAL
jgi:hypothetical protein